LPLSQKVNSCHQDHSKDDPYEAENISTLSFSHAFLIKTFLISGHHQA
jgi:hypothetical protein